MTAKVINLAAWKKAKTEKKRVKGPPRRWGCKNPADIPVQKKGIVSGGVLRCPICGAKCVYTRPIGRGSQTWVAHKPICGFGCAWSGEMHLTQPRSLEHCPGCAQNPLDMRTEDDL
jgi:hypothetical protein